MSRDERRLARHMFFERKKRPAKIARDIGRHISSICRVVRGKRMSNNKSGPMKKLTKKQVDGLVVVLRRLVKKAEGAKEVTCTMVKRSARCVASERTIHRELHA